MIPKVAVLSGFGNSFLLSISDSFNDPNSMIGSANKS